MIQQFTMHGQPGGCTRDELGFHLLPPPPPLPIVTFWCLFTIRYWHTIIFSRPSWNSSFKRHRCGLPSWPLHGTWHPENNHLARLGHFQVASLHRRADPVCQLPRTCECQSEEGFLAGWDVSFVFLHLYRWIVIFTQGKPISEIRSALVPETRHCVISHNEY